MVRVPGNGSKPEIHLLYPRAHPCENLDERLAPSLAHYLYNLLTAHSHLLRTAEGTHHSQQRLQPCKYDRHHLHQYTIHIRRRRSRHIVITVAETVRISTSLLSTGSRTARRCNPIAITSMHTLHMTTDRIPQARSRPSSRIWAAQRLSQQPHKACKLHLHNTEVDRRRSSQRDASLSVDQMEDIHMSLWWSNNLCAHACVDSETKTGGPSRRRRALGSSYAIGRLGKRPTLMRSKATSSSCKSTYGAKMPSEKSISSALHPHHLLSPSPPPRQLLSHRRRNVQ